MTVRSRSSGATRHEHIDGVLVVGGGYAGLHAARAAARHGLPVTLLDPTGRHDFVTRLAAVAGQVAPSRDASRELSAFGHRVMTGTVAGLGDGVVTLADGTERTADAVVFCAGAAATRPPIDGIVHALPLRTSEHALAIRERLDGAGAVSIIGGGATGVQLAGAISAGHAASTVRLIEADVRILPAMTEESAVGATRILHDRGVEIRVGAHVEEISASGLVVDGDALDGIVVWAGGFAPRTDGLDVALDRTGQVLVDPALRVVGMVRSFAAGDVAAHVDDRGHPLPMSAQVAVQAGSVAGANAARVARGEEPRIASLEHRGWVLDLSGNRGIAEFGGNAFASPFADLIPPLLHELLDIKTRFDMGGFSALSF
jgi:NADH dehydrogenase